MNQSQLSVNLGCSPQHFNAVVKGRNNAGVKLAEKLSSVVGGTLDIWMLGKHRKSRKPIIDSYIIAFGKAHNGGKK